MNNYISARLLIAALVVAITIPLVSAESPANPLEYLPGIKGDYFKYDSKVIGRPFHIFVRLPVGYDEEAKKPYPVVYLLDGDSLFPILAPNHLLLTYDEKLPEAVVVGIAYGSFDPDTNKRNYDFSAPAADARSDQGGAPEFLNFLKTELLPTVEDKYRTDSSRRLLFGQSRGGYMVLYTAFTEPDLFWGYIASNPSFDPGRKRFFTAAAPATREDLGLVITSGSRDYPVLREAAVAWFDVWTDRTDAPWDIKTVTIENGTHASYSATSYRIGMVWLFNRNEGSGLR